MIIGAPDVDWYKSHAMDGSGSLREENADRRICRCAYSGFGSGVEAVAPKSEVFCTILVALPVADTSA